MVLSHTSHFPGATSVSWVLQWKNQISFQTAENFFMTCEHCYHVNILETKLPLLQMYWKKKKRIKLSDHTKKEKRET